MRESKVERYLVRQVEALGGLALKFTSPGRRNVPDRVVLLPGGRVRFVECKASGKRLRPAQQRECERLERLGFTVRTVDSVGSVDLFIQAWAVLDAPKGKAQP